MSAEELARKLEELGLPTTGSKAVLRERLRKAIEETSQVTNNSVDDDVLATDNVNDVDTLSKAQLVQRLRQLKLPVTGLKATLRERLQAAMQKGESDEEDSEDEQDEAATAGHSGGVVERHDRESILLTAHRNAVSPSRYNRADHGPDREHNPHEAGTRQVVLTYKDVEDALLPFSGDGTQNVQRWFTAFEETADLCNWTNVQKIIYAKRLLRGSAKLFVNFECQVQSYSAFKKALIKEFGKTLNSHQVHKELSAISKKTNETYQEYVYRVLELASHTEMELEALAKIKRKTSVNKA